MLQITDQARDKLNYLINKTQAEGILAVYSESNCGNRPLFRLCVFEEGDQPETINSIQVLIPEDLKEMLDEARLVLRGTSLVLENLDFQCGRSCKGCPHH